jgi:DNA-binding transcriptional MocR family regulator
MKSSGIGVVPSDSFSVSAQPPEAVRVCIGGTASRDDIQHSLEQIARGLRSAPANALLGAPAVV